MAQMGFFDADRRLAALSAQGDPLEAINKLVPWVSFRADIEAVVLTPTAERKNNAGRKPIDAIVMFRMLVLQALYNLSDEEIEFQINDRMTFMRFLGKGLEGRIPDATTLWLFREKLSAAGVVEKLFERFDRHLQAKGYIARGGQMVMRDACFQHDASIVAVPKQRNTREETDTVKAGKTPEGWEDRPVKNRQKDKDARRVADAPSARWTKKHGKSFFGYKNHINADARHKFIRRYAVSDAAVHDSQKLDDLLMTTNTSRDVFADSAYRSAETEAQFKRQGFNSRIHERAARGRPLSEGQHNANRNKSKVRARVEHVFGAQEMAPGGRLVRSIGIARARAKIGLQNLVYNMRRLATLERMAAA
jgi:IS5 family transposase